MVVLMVVIAVLVVAVVVAPAVPVVVVVPAGPGWKERLKSGQAPGSLWTCPS